MNANFAASLAAVLAHEGGYVNDPQDPGGATNQGVTQQVYDDWRDDRGHERRPVRLIEEAEVENIYLRLYWRPVRGDELPAGVDYCIFDFAVNSGVNRAARTLQKAAGVAADGQIGPVTLAVVRAKPALALIEQVCAARLNFLRQLKIFERFGKGWTRRVEDVAAKAKEMAGS